MKFIILFLLLSVNAFATEVFYNKDTGAVLTISDYKFVNLSSDDKKVITSATLPKSFDITSLTYPWDDYKYEGGKVVLNVTKIAAEESALVKEAQVNQEKETLKESVLKKLVGLGLTEDEAKLLIN